MLTASWPFSGRDIRLISAFATERGYCARTWAQQDECLYSLRAAFYGAQTGWTLRNVRCESDLPRLVKGKNSSEFAADETKVKQAKQLLQYGNTYS